MRKGEDVGITRSWGHSGAILRGQIDDRDDADDGY